MDSSGASLEELIQALEADENPPEERYQELAERIRDNANLTLPPHCSEEPGGPGPEAAVSGLAGVAVQELEPDRADGRPTTSGVPDMRFTISKATIPEKIKLAMLGNSVCRAILIRDSNRMIQEFVLRNPRLQLQEIEEIARSPNISQHVLRRIADTQTWMKAYSVKLHLVTNPKTPGDLSLKWLKFLSMADLKKIARSKGVPQLVSVMAKKKVAEAEQKKH